MNRIEWIEIGKKFSKIVDRSQLKQFITLYYTDDYYMRKDF